MKLFYSVLLAISALLSLVSCGAGKGEGSDRLQSDSIVEESRKKSPYISFKSAEEVREFLNFKKFSDGDRYIAFNGNGGVIDNEAFNITDVKLMGDNNAVISINVPKPDLSGKFILKVSGSDVTILDEESKTTYKLVHPPHPHENR